jgi:LPXTG-motif cell wall-anchored protein
MIGLKKITPTKVFTIIGILFIVGLIIYLLFKKKRTILTVPEETGAVSISDETITYLVSELNRVISASFFTPINYREVYNEVNQKSDFDLIRIANEYNLTYNSNLRTDIENESYWMWSEDLIAAQQLSGRLADLGF